MTDLRFKQLTVENYQEADPTLTPFVRMSGKDGSIRTLSEADWAEKVLAVELSEQVPLEVRRLFAVARGAFLYGFFFYPMYTLGTEQLFRVAESAVNGKCRDVGVSAERLRKLNFKEKVERLIKKGVIQPNVQRRWEALWELRGMTSHPEDQTGLLAYTAIDELRRIAADINGLFAE